MKKLTKYQLKKISNNLDFFFNIASSDDIKNGLNWYKQANLEIQKISNLTNIDVFKVAAVVSCLSPRNKWSNNIKDALKVCEAYKYNLGPNDIKVSTFNINKFKAFNVLNNTTSITIDSLKTYNFVNNIAYLHPYFLTVDIWHLRACFKDNININSAAIGKIAYEQIKRLTINKAKKLNLYGYQFQAIIWLSAQTYFKNNK